jgi:long-chain acyl-CoA synthetase
MTATQARTESRPTATTTVVTRIRDRAAATPTDVALRSKDFGLWQETSWAEYWDEIQDVAHALLALGVARGDRVAIQSENRKEWLTVDLGAVAIGAATVGIYPTNPAAEVVHLLSDSAAKVLLSEDQEQVDKALEVSDRTPDLQTIVYVEPRGVRGRYDDGRLMFWEDFLARGREHRAAHPGAVEEAMAQTRPEDLMTLIYTSGTTGLPKGAMLSVANVEATIAALTGPGLVEPPAGPKDLALSYLPLSHVAERIFTTWNNAATGIQVNFAESIETVPANLREIQPTFFFAVPRIWEKLKAGLEAMVHSEQDPERRRTLEWALEVGHQKVRFEQSGQELPAELRAEHEKADSLVLSKLRDQLGLDQLEAVYVGAAPTPLSVLEFFHAIGIPVAELWGLSESTGSGTVNLPDAIKLGTVGQVAPGMQLKLADDGEVLLKGPQVMKGYRNLPDKTAEAIDGDGWLHTGDIGELDEDGYLRIVDRKKELIITAGGKNISPANLEAKLKAHSLIGTACVIGDGRPFLTALVVLDPDVAPAWAAGQGIDDNSLDALAADDQLHQEIQRAVEGVNAEVSKVEGIKRFTVLGEDWLPGGDELTPTMKLKRKPIAEKYAGDIEAMYSA